MSALVAEYERLVMMQACLARGLLAPVTFEVQVGRLPPGIDHLVAAGLEQVVQYLKSFSFSEAEQAWLASEAVFTPAFLAYAKALRFDGDVHAMPEGSIFFADEPVLRITAPLPLAQYLETRVLNLLHYETSVCSWASRLVMAANDRRLIDSTLGSTPSPEPALLAARACYLAGFEATSSPDACRRFRIPLARSLTVCWHDTVPMRPEALGAVVYDASLAQPGIDFVRLVGDKLPAQAVGLRTLLDAQGLSALKILACGDFDRDHIAALAACGAPIDALGPRLFAPGADATPALDTVYALQHRRDPDTAQAPIDANRGRQVWREFAANGCIARDTVALEGERGPPGTTPLLHPVMRHGRRLGHAITLEASRAHRAEQVQTLPPALRRGDPTAPPIEVLHSKRLADARAVLPSAPYLAGGAQHG